MRHRTKRLLCCFCWTVRVPPPVPSARNMVESWVLLANGVWTKRQRGVSSYATFWQRPTWKWFSFGDCFFMTWQSYCCRWGQRRGTRGRWMLFWVFVSGCASMGPSMLCCVKSGGGFYRHLWLVSMFPCCLIQSFLIRPRNQTEGGGGWKTAALTNVNIIKSLLRLTVGAE